MLYYFSVCLEQWWGPFRLFRSHALLLAAGTLLAAFAVLLLLPKLWRFSPHDHGKAILGKDGMTSAGKPTGTGLWVTLIVLPILLLVMPLSVPVLGMIFCLYMAMAFGYLDDRAVEPWGQLKKGVLDAAVCLGVAYFVWSALGGEVWLPFVKGEWTMPWWAYVPCMGFVLFIVMNATNCSDGVDGLAGSLTIISRKIYPVIPPKTEYALTNLGKATVLIVHAMDKWGADFFTQLDLPIPCDDE